VLYIATQPNRQNEMKKYIELKEAVANRSPKELGYRVKRSEIVHHHEITNQILLVITRLEARLIFSSSD